LQNKLGLSSHEMAYVGGALFAYLFHRPDIDQRTLVKLVGDPEKAERVLSMVRTDGEVLKNCKLYAWAFYKSRFGSPKPKASDFGVTLKDAKFLSRLNLKHLPLTYPAYSVEDFDTLVSDTITGQSLSSYIGKFISKKMTFLIKSYGVRRDDLQADMETAAIKALYMSYPRFESLLHFENTAKSAIHNTGQTLITYHTSPGRQRLYVNHEGMTESYHVQVDEVLSLEAPSTYLAHAKEHLEALVNISHRVREDAQEFLLCCAGHFHEGFSEFLGSDNSVLVDNVAFSRYQKKAQTYFGYTDNQVQKLFTRLQQHIR